MVCNNYKSFVFVQCALTMLTIEIDFPHTQVQIEVYHFHQSDFFPTAEKEQDIMYDVVFDEQFLGGLTVRYTI